MMIKIDPHCNALLASQFTNQRTWARLAWPGNHHTWREFRRVEQNCCYVKITALDHQENKKQAVFMYVIPSGKVVFGLECILEMSHFIARANV